MFLAAWRQFGDQRFYDAALDCGEVLWHRGLIIKGNGLCHGITGNMYPLMTLAKETGDAKWQIRAHLFAQLSFNQDVMNIVAKTPDRQRKVPGKPDSPFSLMEGIGGDLVAYIDLMLGDPAFPGYEV